MCAQLPLEVGVADVSAVSVTTGVLSALAVFPAAAVVLFLFRLPKVKGSGAAAAKGEDGLEGFRKGEFHKRRVCKKQ